MKIVMVDRPNGNRWEQCFAVMEPDNDDELTIRLSPEQAEAIVRALEKELYGVHLSQGE